MGEARCRKWMERRDMEVESRRKRRREKERESQGKRSDIQAIFSWMRMQISSGLAAGNWLCDRHLACNLPAKRPW